MWHYSARTFFVAKMDTRAPLFTLHLVGLDVGVFPITNMKSFIILVYLSNAFPLFIVEESKKGSI